MQASPTKTRRPRRTKAEMDAARKLAREQGLPPSRIRLGAPVGSATAKRRSEIEAAHRKRAAANGVSPSETTSPLVGDDLNVNYTAASGGRVVCETQLPFTQAKGMLDRNAIEWELKNHWPKHLKAALSLCDADTSDFDSRIDKLPFRSISGDYVKPLTELEDLSIASYSYATFGRAMTTRVRFGSSNYNLLEVSILVNVHHVILLSLVNLHGMDWAHRLNVKLLQRNRGLHTLFNTDGNWHTPHTFAFVYGGTPALALRALEEGKKPEAKRSMDAAINDLSKTLNVHRDGFGLLAMGTHMPVFTYFHMPEMVILYPNVKVPYTENRQLPNVLDIEDVE